VRVATNQGSAFDLLAAYLPPEGSFFEHEHVGASSAGTAARIEARGALRALREVGDDAIALGALPFSDAADAVLAVGARTVSRTESGAGVHVSEIGSARFPGFRLVRGTPADPFSELQLHEAPAADRYAGSVGAIAERIRAGQLRKVVLARTIAVDAGRTLDPRRLVQRLRSVDPAAYAFAMPTVDGVLVGASPELLVSRSGRGVRSNPLAGSAPRSGDADEDRANGQGLLVSAKNREEHAVVVEAVAATLGPFCERLSWDPEPVVHATPNVWHLSTRFQGTLREPAPSVLELVLALHPTPAVAGTPTAEALQAIEELEPFPRGAYAGPVGWMDARGDGAWAIALRCAELVGERAVLYAGAGIVAASEPDAEVDETERKFRAFLDALRWG
jgi:isochorismate synthase